MKSKLRVIDNDHPHARDIARQRIAEFRPNTQRESLPVVNVQDSGAPLLRRDEVVRGSYPTYGPATTRRSLWNRIFGR